MKRNDDHIELKWGKIRWIRLQSKKGQELIEKYKHHQFLSVNKKGSLDKKEKVLALAIIKECKSKNIIAGISGENMTKKEAREYIKSF